jgi:DNA helicase-2/ATP-dependent DNA helicase PcrA
VGRWLGEHPDGTVAALTYSNYLADKLVDELKRRGIPYNDNLLRASSTARTTVKGFQALLAYLCDSKSAGKLADLFRVWQRSQSAGPEQDQAVERSMEWLRRVSQVEDFLWPDPGDDLLQTSGLLQKEPDVYTMLVCFRDLARRWMGAMQYPIDQVILTVAHDLLKSPVEWAIAQNLAGHLRRTERLNPELRLPDLLTEVASMDSSGSYKGFGTDENGFDPQKHPGEVVVATIHKAKGLEWDRVYLLSVNSYDFPSAIEGDRYRAEPWFFQPGVNLTAEALAQLDVLVSTDPYTWYEPGLASQQARFDLARERLRLLYVGITRARRELVITWNTGSRHDLHPALPLTALEAFWRQRLEEIVEG